MTIIIQEINSNKTGEESPIDIMDMVETNGQGQDHQARPAMDGRATVGSTKTTRMRFAVAILGVISLAMGQISRTVINYSITSMVDPRMLHTNTSSISTGESCPARTISPELVQVSDEEILALFTTEHPEYQTTIEDSLISERIYISGRREQESASSHYLDESHEPEEDKFMWTAKQQSLIKGGFFYSYFFFMILGGRIAEVYGAKYVILIGVAGSAIINLATPWMARNSFPMLILSRIVMGTIQSAGFPAMYALINRWLTMSEASIFAPMLKMSLRVGQVLASMAPGLIPDWPNVFYVVGLLGIIWSVFWVFLATSDPSTNSWVSQAELAHIMENKKGKKELTSNEDAAKTSKSFKTPWIKIITSPSVIGLVIAKLSFSMCNSLITIELPSYLRYVYHATMQEMSAVTTVMFSIQVPLTLSAGWLAKVMVEKRPFSFSTTSIRKIFQSLATFGSGISLFLMTLKNCDLLYTGIFLQIVAIFAVFVAGGETMLPYDLSEEYPATIMAIANSISNLSGIIVTALTGLVLGIESGSQSRWNTVIIVVAAANIFGGLMFCLLVKAKPIDFDSENEKENGDKKSIEDGDGQDHTDRKCH